MFAFLAMFAGVVSAHAAGLNPTPTMMGVYGSISFQGAAVEKGDEVRAYTPEGLLVGQFVIEADRAGEYGFMPIYGDDTTTAEKDGAVEGDAIKIVLYRISDKQERVPQHLSTGKLDFAASAGELRLDLMF
jgi:hypothetical protein